MINKPIFPESQVFFDGNFFTESEFNAFKQTAKYRRIILLNKILPILAATIVVIDFLVLLLIKIKY